MISLHSALQRNVGSVVTVGTEHCKLQIRFTFARSVSSDTPSQVVPNLDQRVTQCRSTVTVSVGNSRKDFQSHRCKTLLPSSIANFQRSSEMRGVGPADKTGKSVVRYWPGGNFASADVRRPENPRETIAIGISPIS